MAASMGAMRPATKMQRRIPLWTWMCQPQPGDGRCKSARCHQSGDGRRKETKK